MAAHAELLAATRPPPNLQAAPQPRLLGSGLAVVRRLTPFARRHWRWFLLGAACGLAVVAARLLLPWPLRAVAEQLNGGATSPLLALLPAGIDPIIALGTAFLLLAFSLGWSDYMQRLAFARFAIDTVNDVRARALEAAPTAGLEGGATRELTARLIGDAGRIKSGLRLFLVHVATSGVLLLGMTAILFHMNTGLGVVFAAATLASGGVTWWAAAGTLKLWLQRRRKENEYAERIERAAQGGAAAAHDHGESGSEARQTRLQGIATWSTQAIFGVAVLLALWLGSRAVRAGTMTSGDMVVFMMYALMVQSPIVRLARQGTRSGKIVGASSRLLQLLGDRARNPR